MSIENDITSIIIIFRKVKMGLNSWGYEFESLAIEKNGKLDNEQFGIYPLAMLDRIILQNDSLFKGGKVSIDTKFELTTPFAYCRLTNEMVKEIINSMDVVGENMNERWKIFLSKLSEQSDKIDLVLDDKKSNEYAIVRYKTNEEYKTHQRKENVEYLCKEIEKSVIGQSYQQKTDNEYMGKKENLYDLKKSFESIKKESKNPFDVDIDDTPLYPKTETDQETELDSEKSRLDLSNIDIDKVIRETSQKIIGQDSAIESIVSNIYANQKIIQTGNTDLIATQKTSILLDGPTGTGKTAIVKEVSDKFSIPMVIKNSTSYSTTGYVGDSITDILAELIEKAHGYIELAQRGIVCLDEFDKLGEANKQSEISMRRAVQQELLPFISGGKFQVQVGGHYGKKIEFDTSNLTFIGMGAFTELRENKIAQKNKKISIGFVSQQKETNHDKTYEITEQDYIDYGLERELVGRFALLTSTKAYSVEDFKKILLTSTISPIKTFIEFAKSQGIEDVTYDAEFIEKMSQMAYDANFGARGLHKIMQDIKNTLLRDIITGRLKRINLTTDMLEKSKEKSIRTY